MAQAYIKEIDMSTIELFHVDSNLLQGRWLNIINIFWKSMTIKVHRDGESYRYHRIIHNLFKFFVD